MKLVGITARHETSPTAWWRIVRPFTMLQEMGYDAKWGWLRADDTPEHDVKDAIVVAQRVVVDDAKGWVKRLGAKKVIFELDDDTISEHYIEHMKACGRISPASFAKIDDERKKQIETLRAGDAITVTTPALKDVVEKYIDKPVHVVPNAIDVDWFTAHLGGKISDKITIGWAGGLRPERDLIVMAKAWGYIAEKYKDVMFVSAGFQHDCIYQEVDLDRIIRIPWQDLEAWPRSMQVDIGCCPLVTTMFNKCKSPIKAFEYGLAGAAVIANPIVYQDIENCLPAYGLNSWFVALEKLIEDEKYRREMAINLREEIKDEFSLRANIGNWIEAYEN